MSASLFEIVELANGDVVLQRADEEGEPLLSIRFSTESLTLMRDGKFDIAKAMIEAGMEAANDLPEDDESAFEAATTETESALYDKRTLH
ncbi:hypothetical protein KO507_05055 [Gilvimarinus agarilyticus]|uniref:hypothetical protein n=1 Tax=unclassified Gilvimarinus TaxID=2642066 RepID=UPI001C08170E|nr:MULTISPECIES: hypothetical protein [unclassified Gilvimarinus]MBU2885130.1 hypothetical protein [Gilvimarinus agarilyticus]MDO6570028.1 hypothetical protein [Gilvimarinus sp. 2_MG-2023]MDO6747295.1 hypothetical protein [Gilvimarinus sp. 1_MG-2023]